METLPKSLLFFIDAAFGGYNLSVFDVFEPDRMFLKWFGIIFILVFVFLNLLILLNILIAMMADTYSLMTSVRKGLYNGNIIRAVPAYKTNKYYGGLLVLIPPFSILSFLLLPFYMCIKDKGKLQFLTNSIFMALYSFVALFLSIYYIIANLVMMPFAYLKTIAHKINLLRMKKIKGVECLSYVLLGLPLLFVSQFTDYVTFLRVSFATRKRYQSDEVHVITTGQFHFVNRMFIKAAHEQEKNPDNKIKATDLVLSVKEAFKVEQRIMTTIYGIRYAKSIVDENAS